MKAPCLLAFGLLLVGNSEANAQSTPAHLLGGVPVAPSWPGAVSTPDTPRHSLAAPVPASTFAGAVVGSFVGLLGGGYLGYVLTKDGSGDYDGAAGAVYGGALAAILGSAGLATAMSGIPTSDVFSRAFGGAFLGALAGAGGGLIIGGLTDSGLGWLVGWALGQGTATTIGVLTGDYAGASGNTSERSS